MLGDIFLVFSLFSVIQAIITPTTLDFQGDVLKCTLDGENEGQTLIIECNGIRNNGEEGATGRKISIVPDPVTPASNVIMGIAGGGLKSAGQIKYSWPRSAKISGMASISDISSGNTESFGISDVYELQEASYIFHSLVETTTNTVYNCYQESTASTTSWSLKIGEHSATGELYTISIVAKATSCLITFVNDQMDMYAGVNSQLLKFSDVLTNGLTSSEIIEIGSVIVNDMSYDTISIEDVIWLATDNGLKWLRFDQEGTPEVTNCGTTCDGDWKSISEIYSNGDPEDANIASALLGTDTLGELIYFEGGPTTPVPRSNVLSIPSAGKFISIFIDETPSGLVGYAGSNDGYLVRVTLDLDTIEHFKNEYLLNGTVNQPVEGITRIGDNLIVAIPREVTGGDIYNSFPGNIDGVVTLMRFNLKDYCNDISSSVDCPGCIGEVGGDPYYCEWSLDNTNCFFKGDGSGTVTDTCPVIFSTTPKVAELSSTESVTIQVTGSNVVNGLTYQCRWNQSINTPATRLGIDSISCNTPITLSDGTLNVQIIGNTKPYTSIIPFEFYDCSLRIESCGICTSVLDPQCTSNCDDAYISLPACNFCSFTTCSTSGGAGCFTGIGVDGCPELSISPQAVEFKISEIDDQVISATLTDSNNDPVNFLPIVYNCSFKGPIDVTFSAVTVNNVATCTIPSGTLPEGDYKFDIISLSTGGVGVTLEPQDFFIFNCSLPSPTDECDVCLPKGNNLCGWCIDSTSHECMVESDCSSIWLSECPVAESVTPLSGDPKLEDATTITISGPNYFPEGSSAPNLICKWTRITSSSITVETTATVVDNVTITCPSPSEESLALNDQNTYELALVYGSDPEPLIDISNEVSIRGIGYEFIIIECRAVLDDTCTICSGNEDTSRSSSCGWCLTNARCGPLQACDSSLYIELDKSDECPKFLSISPNKVKRRGGDDLTIVGESFFNTTPAIEIRYSGSQKSRGFFRQLRKQSDCVEDGGTITCPTVYEGENNLQTITPSLQKGDINVDLIFFGKVFASGSDVQFETESGGSSDGGDDTAPIVGGVVGALLFCVCCCCCIVLCIIIVVCLLLLGSSSVVLLKTRGSSINEFDLDLIEPNYEAIAFTGMLSVKYSIPSSQMSKYESLEELLLHTEYASAICAITQATEADKVTKSFVYLYESRDEALALILVFISEEVENSKREGTLFRANSMASKMFKTYSKIVGLKYLWKTLARPLNELNVLGEKELGEDGVSLLSHSVEMDPDKLSVDDDETVNRLQLQLLSQKLFSAIMKSKSNLPRQFCEICSHLKEEVSQKFPEAVYKAIGGFLFLRFLVPAITAPHMYGLFPETSPPNQHCQRQLILLSKVLQNLANGVEFGAKEPFMAKLNDFIHDNLAKLHGWMDDISDPSGSEYTLPVPSTVTQNSLGYLHNHIVNNLEKINTQLGDDEEMKADLQSCLDEQGPPPRAV